MKREPQDDTLLRSYLLGELREEEADRLERRLLEEDELFELAEAVEADLLAAADRGELAPAERERVLRRLASSPQGRERLALARSLNAMTAEREPVVVPFPRRVPAFPPPAIHWIALAASLLMLSGLGWFAWTNREQAPAAATRVAAQTPTPASPQPHAPGAMHPAPPPANPHDETTTKTPPKPEPQRPAATTVDVLTLTLQSLRGADEEMVAKLHLSPGSRTAEFQIDMEGTDAKSFNVAIHREERTIWEKSALKPIQMSGSPVLVVDVPAEILPAGHYEIAVIAEGESEEMSQKFGFEVVQTNP